MPQTIELSKKFGSAALATIILSLDITEGNPTGGSGITYEGKAAMQAVISAIRLGQVTLDDLEKLNNAGIIFIANSESPEDVAKIIEMFEKGSGIPLLRFTRPGSTTEAGVALRNPLPEFSITLNGKTPTLNLLEPTHP